MNEIRVIAEIGCNHMGSMEMAHELIGAAKLCNADVVKFQKRDIDTWTEMKPDQYNAPHGVPWNAFGETYREHRLALEFDLEQHRQLQAWANEAGVEYSTSVWDCPSAEECITLAPSLLKVPSACNTNIELMTILRDSYDGEVHVSTGMSTHKEVEAFVRLFEETDQAKDRLVVYHCTSGYPVPFENCCMLELMWLKEQFGHRIKGLGFSGHHKGLAIDNAAVVLGATWIERHFTLDRTLKGTDHAASLEPVGLQKLVRDLNATAKTLSYKPDEMMEIERVQRDKLKYLG